MVKNLIVCRICGKQHNGITATKFHAGFNNYISARRNFRKEQKTIKSDA